MRERLQDIEPLAQYEHARVTANLRRLIDDARMDADIVALEIRLRTNEQHLIDDRCRLEQLKTARG